MSNLTYYDAINYLANSGKLRKAIADLSTIAEMDVYATNQEKSVLKAERRTAKQFIESNMSDAEKVNAIRLLIEE